MLVLGSCMFSMVLQGLPKASRKSLCWSGNNSSPPESQLPASALCHQHLAHLGLAAAVTIARFLVPALFFGLLPWCTNPGVTVIDIKQQLVKLLQQEEAVSSNMSLEQLELPTRALPSALDSTESCVFLCHY